jgi:coenzyme F420-dependent glucose-6-phosphate dehydrogenase
MPTPEATLTGERVAVIGYHASHEQFAPSELLGHVHAAEQAGFQAAMCSDHFTPWGTAQGQSGFSWSWLGAAMHATRLPFGIVTTPGWRYHPTILAQAVATLDEMFPGRFWVAMGSGEAMNEHIVGEHWPPKRERNERLAECVAIARALWQGETVTHRGHVRVDEATLWTRPRTTPMIVGPALSPETAEWLGGWADALITVNADRDRLGAIVDAFRRGGGEGKPMFLQVHLSYAPSDDEALRVAHEQWATAIEAAVLAQDLRTARQFDAAAKHVRPEDMRAHVRISSDPARHVGWLEEDLAMGFTGLYLHQVARDQRRFIDDFGERVLPALG